MRYRLFLLLFFNLPLFAMHTEQNKLPWEEFAVAVTKDEADVVQQYLKNYVATPDELWNAAFLAAGHKANVTLKILLEYPIEINKQAKEDGLTLLHAAAIMKNASGVAQLLKKNARINLRAKPDFDSKTVLEIAFENTNFTGLERLEERIAVKDIYKLIQDAHFQLLTENIPLLNYSFGTSKSKPIKKRLCPQWCNPT